MASMPIQSAEILRVSKNKLLFSVKELKKFGIGTIIKITDGTEEIGRAKVIKVGVKKAVAVIFQGEGLIFQGYKVSIMVLKLNDLDAPEISGDRTSKKNGSKTKLPRKIALLGGGSFKILGDMSGGDEYDPTSFASYLGFKLEVNFRFRSLGVCAGFDYHQGVEAVEMPSQTFTSEEFQANGQTSDVYLGAQYYLDRFGFRNYYVTGMFVPIARHKITRTLDTGEFQNVFSGTGIGIGVGKELIFNSWLIQLNGLFKSYSLSIVEYNSEAGPESIAISHSSISLNILFGYHF